MNVTFTGTRDADREILLSIDSDEDLLNTCILNTYTQSLCNEMFFYNRMLRKYPLLLKRKPNQSTWKQYYLKIVHYLAKLQEDFGIPYIPVTNFVPVREYHGFSNSKKYDRYLYLASLVNDRNLIKHFLDKGADVNMGLIGAAESGNRELVDYFISLGANKYNYALLDAAEKGHKHLIDYFISLGALIHYGIQGAVEGYHKWLIDYLIEKGATIIDLNQGFRADRMFSIEETKNMIDYLISKGANNFDIGLRSAAVVGDINLAKYFISLGANDFNGALRDLALFSQDHLSRHQREMGNFLVDSGADNLNQALRIAAGRGYLDMMKLAIKLGATNLNQALLRASREGKLDAVKLLIERGATNIQAAKEAALHQNQLEVYEYLNSL